MTRRLSIKLLHVLELCADGMTCPEIAVELKLSESTIKREKEIILIKLGADNMSQAVAMAFRRGLLR